MASAIRNQVAQDHFRGANGSTNFFPNPATWLNAGQWTDEIGETQQQRKDRESEQTMKQARLEIENDA